LPRQSEGNFTSANDSLEITEIQELMGAGKKQMLIVEAKIYLAFISDSIDLIGLVSF
jgi:hypothetical protein